MAEKEGLYRYVDLQLNAESARRVEQEAHRALSKGTSPREAVANFQQVEKSSGRVAAAAKRMGVAIVAAFAAQRVKQFAVDMFNVGTTAEETGSKFTTTFGEAEKQVQSFLDEWAEFAGLNRTVGREMTATAGAIVQGMGASKGASADFSEQMLRLAGDLQSFHNVPIDETFTAIKSGLVGSWEPLDRYGIVLRQADVDQRALLDTGKANAKQLTQLEKAQAALNLMYERAGPALGDLARTQDSTANKTRQLVAEYENFRIELATELLPVFAEIVGFLSDNKDSISDGARTTFNVLKEGATQAWEILTDITDVLTDIGEVTRKPVEWEWNISVKFVGEGRKAGRWLIENTLGQFVDVSPTGNIVYDLFLGVPIAESRAAREQRRIDRETALSMLNDVDSAGRSRLAQSGAGSPAGSGGGGGGGTTPLDPKELKRRVDKMIEDAERIRRGNRGVFAREHIEGLRDSTGAIVYPGRAPDRAFGSNFAPSRDAIIQSVESQTGPMGVITADQLTEFQRMMEAMELSAEDTAMMMAGAFDGFFSTLFTGLAEGADLFETMGAAAEGVGRAIIAQLTEGAAQWQMAEGAADLAGGSWPPNPAQLAAASMHFAAAGAFRALASIVGGGGRAFVPSGNTGPTAGDSLAREPSTTPIQILVTANGILAGSDPVIARQIGEAMALDAHLSGTPTWVRED